jgi:hypothetical protein
MFERDEDLERGAYDGYTSDERQDREDALARQRFREGPKYRPDESPTKRDMEEQREGWQDRQQASGAIVATLSGCGSCPWSGSTTVRARS